MYLQEYYNLHGQEKILLVTYIVGYKLYVTSARYVSTLLLSIMYINQHLRLYNIDITLIIWFREKISTSVNE